MTHVEPPRLVVCPICGVRFPDHTGGATLEHEDVNLHTWTPGPLPDEPLELEDQDDG
jgi:hypothetical protein